MDALEVDVPETLAILSNISHDIVSALDKESTTQNTAICKIEKEWADALGTATLSPFMIKMADVELGFFD